MEYALLIYSPPEHAEATPHDWAKMGPPYAAYTQMLRDRNVWVDGAPLAPTTSATTVRIKDGEKAVLDGPFAETKEWLAGYYVVKADSLDEALAYAEQCPGLQFGSSIEVRPVVDGP
jgi:hypothetical protein